MTGDEAPTVEDVLEAARRAMEAARAARSFEDTEGENVTVEGLVRWIGARLASVPARAAVSTRDWFRVLPTDGARTALLLALLELARKGILLLYQEEDFAAIRVKSLREVPEDLQFEAFLYESMNAAAS
jgi:chromatin segregation and condensation protein Rec8/ScpA/Scc1 (kleisin family)